MSQRGRGGIVLMSSLTAFQGTPLLTTYGATKAFNLTLAEGLHAELHLRGVDVMACCAGATTTPGLLKTAPDGAPGQLNPEQVVAEALGQLGRRAFMIPGAFNRFASMMMRRLMPRSTTVNILAKQAQKLRLTP
jgi:short-subunit dehydrogenase